MRLGSPFSQVWLAISGAGMPTRPWAVRPKAETAANDTRIAESTTVRFITVFMTVPPYISFLSSSLDSSLAPQGALFCLLVLVLLSSLQAHRLGLPSASGLHDQRDQDNAAAGTPQPSDVSGSAAVQHIVTMVGNPQCLVPYARL